MPWWLMPYLVLFLPFGAVFATVYLLVWAQRRGNRRTPLTRNMLRAPGQSLGMKLRELEWDLPLYMMMPALLPLLLYCVYLSNLLYGPRKVDLFLTIFYLLTGITTVLFLIIKLIRVIKTLRKYRLGLDAERAVGQELDQLLRQGYWVFHDVPGEKFNIDHVVVGPSGVFAVETKGRTKPGRDVKEGWRVKYDGERLQFPGWVETEPLQQAQRQAKWLQSWLSSAVGESVAVQPVLALPGWFIERTSAKGIPVINGRNAEGIFKGLSRASLSEKLVQQIVHQLDQRCRDVSASAYTQA